MGKLNNHGPVAQLGERLVCIQEVVGSNPVGSTSTVSAASIQAQAGSAGFPARAAGAWGDVASGASRRSPRRASGPIAQSG